MTITQEAAICLIKSAITGQPQTLPEGYSFTNTSGLLYKNGLLTLGYAGAVNCGIEGEPDIMKRILDIYCVEFLNSERQLAGLTALYNAFEAQGIDYMPVKGAVMKYSYPSHELRTMSDADILIRPEQKEQIARIVTELGYTFESESDHEWNWSNESLRLELHKRLVSSDEKHYYSYFGDGWQRATLQDGHRWQLSQEDAFVFEFSHFTRHYCKGGIGIRHMVDLWVHLYQAADMDLSYVRRQMQALQLESFYDHVMTAIQALFYDGQWTPEAEYITQFVFGRGTVSHDEAVADSASASSGSSRQGKLKTLLRKAFPAKKHITWNYPQFKKLPLPIAWVARWFSLLKDRKTVKNRLSQMQRITDETVDSYRKSLRYVGLDVFE